MPKGSWGEIGRSALRIFGYTVAFGFIGFMFTPALMGASAVIRVPVIGALIVGACMLMFVDGSYRGEQASALSERLDKLERQGDYTPTPQEDAKRYHRLKGILAAAIAAAPAFLMALYVALTATPYAYSLQDIPPWLTAYLARPEVGGALSYMELPALGATLTDYFRVAVRFLLFPFVGLLGTMTDDLSLLFDRISPVLVLVLPLMSAIGYQFGPRRRAKYVAQIDQAKRTPRRRLKKDRKQQTSREKKQLV